jgi:rod shape-determining protein MreD
MFRLFLWTIFIQIFVLNNIQLSGYINPYYYLIFILYIPSKTSKALTLILSFLIGFSIDIFSQSYGAHAFASVLIGYMKILLLGKTGKNKEGDELIELKNLSINKFIILASYFIIIHHFTLFFLERFNINEFFSILKMTIPSSIFTLFLLIIHQIFRIKKT